MAHAKHIKIQTSIALTLLYIGVMVTSIPLAAISEMEGCIEYVTTIKGSSLNGHFFEGDEIRVKPIHCGLPKFGDFAVFQGVGRADGYHGPAIKQVWGIPGDTLVIRSNGTMTINSVLALTPHHKPYYLRGLTLKKFKRFEGVLDGYLLLGHHASFDSTIFGLLKAQYLTGVVTRNQSRKYRHQHNLPPPY